VREQKLNRKVEQVFRFEHERKAWKIDNLTEKSGFLVRFLIFSRFLVALCIIIMSIHIAAQQGEIADKILLPGDPLRAKFIAENFMGMPSISIYARELIVDYGVKKLIRVGTAGSLNEDVHVRELVLAQAAATNSNIVRNDWPQYDFPQIASFDLLDKAYHIAKELGMTTHVGNVLSSDVFYSNYFEKNIELGKWGVKAVEMEAAALYYLAAQHHVDALAIMTISDSLVNPDEDTTAEERQNTFTDMMKVGLETLIAD